MLKLFRKKKKKSLPFWLIVLVPGTCERLHVSYLSDTTYWSLL